MSEKYIQVKYNSYFKDDIANCMPAIGNVVQSTEASDPEPAAAQSEVNRLNTVCVYNREYF